MEQNFLTSRYSKGQIKFINNIVFYDCVDNMCDVQIQHMDHDKTKIINYGCSKITLFNVMQEYNINNINNKLN
jgi:hypothetical protein